MMGFLTFVRGCGGLLSNELSREIFPVLSSGAPSSTAFSLQSLNEGEILVRYIHWSGDLVPKFEELIDSEMGSRGYEPQSREYANSFLV